MLSKLHFAHKKKILVLIFTFPSLFLTYRLGMDAKTLMSIFNTSTGRCWSSEMYNPVPGMLPNVPSSNGYKVSFALVHF